MGLFFVLGQAYEYRNLMSHGCRRGASRDRLHYARGQRRCGRPRRQEWLAAGGELAAIGSTMRAANAAAAAPDGRSGWLPAVNLYQAVPVTLVLIASSFTCQMGVFAAERATSSGCAAGM